MINKFNTDTEALLSRIDVNSSNAKFDLEEWLIDIIKPIKDLNVLDIGCGTGKQIFQLAPLISSKGSILGIDLSPTSVKIVNQFAEDKGISWARAEAMDIDDSIKILNDESFDLIISTYAIYYSKDVEKLLIELKKKLTGKGFIFICGPGKNSNEEIYKIINSHSKNSLNHIKSIENFLSSEQIVNISEFYSKYSTHLLKNKIYFNSANEIMQWWRNHNSYIEELDKEVENSIIKHFSKHEKFGFTKNVFGVLFYV